MKEGLRQISGLTNRNRIRHKLRIRLQHKSKSNNYTESACVNAAGRWRERLRFLPGEASRTEEAPLLNPVETRFIVRSQMKPY